MSATKTDKTIFAMSNEELQWAIVNAERKEIEVRNYLAELRLHRMMRKHVKRQHIKSEIAALQRQLEEESHDVQ